MPEHVATLAPAPRPYEGVQRDAREIRMNDVLDRHLRDHEQQRVAAQPAPVSLDALRRATSRRARRPAIAAAAVVLAAAATAAIPIARSLAGYGSTQHSAGAAAPTRSARSTAAPGESAIPSELVLRTLAARAKAVARDDGDPNATGEAVRTTYADAERVILAGSTTSVHPGSTKVWVVQLHGTFTCSTCSFPARGLAPRGSAIALIIDAGTLDGWDLTVTRQPHDLARLGAVVPLAM
jgi:hypothetical protein